MPFQLGGSHFSGSFSFCYDSCYFYHCYCQGYCYCLYCNRWHLLRHTGACCCAAAAASKYHGWCPRGLLRSPPREDGRDAGAPAAICGVAVRKRATKREGWRCHCTPRRANQNSNPGVLHATLGLKLAGLGPTPASFKPRVA